MCYSLYIVKVSGQVSLQLSLQYSHIQVHISSSVAQCSLGFYIANWELDLNV